LDPDFSPPEFPSFLNVTMISFTGPGFTFAEYGEKMDLLERRSSSSLCLSFFPADYVCVFSKLLFAPALSDFPFFFLRFLCPCKELDPSFGSPPPLPAAWALLFRRRETFPPLGWKTHESIFPPAFPFRILFIFALAPVFQKAPRSAWARISPFSSKKFLCSFIRR